MQRDILFNSYDVFLKRYFDITPYHFQRQLAYKIILAALRRQADIIPIEVARQGGKTTGVVLPVAFLLHYAPRTINMPLSIGIFASQKEQANTDFDRLKTALDRIDRIEETQPAYTVFETEKINARTLRLDNGSEAYIFPITKTSHPESKTFHLMIFEEAQNIDDHEMKTKIWPMGAATGAPKVYIGTAGYQKRYFLKLIRDREKYSPLIFNYKQILRQKQEAYELDGNSDHLKYAMTIERDRDEMGENSDEFRTQYRLKWVLGRRQFVTEENLYALKEGAVIKQSDEEATAGIDTAKDPDSTVVTVKLLKSNRIANWLVLHGDNYEDQFHAICSFLKNFKNIRKVAIDATGQGDFMPDLFENNTGYAIERVKFSLPTKDIMYKNLISVIRNKLTKYPNADTSEVKRFEQEMLDLQKEYKGELMSCHHPDSADAHDDFCDSFALAEYAHKLLIEEGEPSIEII